MAAERMKNTLLGTPNAGWELTPISALADIKGRVGWKGYTKKDLRPYGVLTIGAKHIDKENRLDLSDPTFLSREKFVESPEISIRKFDVLVVQRGSIGRVVLIDRDLGDATINPSMVILRHHKVDPVFLFYQLTSPFGQSQLVLDTSSTGVPMITQRQIGAFLIPLPSTLEEQKRIAAALSDADALIASLDALIAKKRDLKQAAMQQLLTGKTRLPGFMGEWESKRLGEIGKFLKGSGVRRDEAQSGDLPCVRYGEIYTVHQNVIRNFSSYISQSVAEAATRIQFRDLLFAGSGETKEEIGKCVALADDVEAYAGGDIVILRVSAGSPVFLGYLMNTPSVVRQKANRGQGDAVVHINAAALASIEIVLPDESEQDAIAAVLNDMDTELAALEAQRGKAHALKQGMMQELLTGRIRLV